MSSKHKTLQSLVHHQAKDLHFAERHAAKLLKKLAKAADASSLREALDARHDARDTRCDRLDAVFAALDEKPHGVPCEAMEGLVAETKELLDTFEEGAVLDAALIAAAEAVEHYAVARYTALQRWASQLGLTAAAAPVASNLADAREALARWAEVSASPAAHSTRSSEPLTLKQAALMGLG